MGLKTFNQLLVWQTEVERECRQRNYEGTKQYRTRVLKLSKYWSGLEGDHKLTAHGENLIRNLVLDFSVIEIKEAMDISVSMTGSKDGGKRFAHVERILEESREREDKYARKILKHRIEREEKELAEKKKADEEPGELEQT